MTYMMANPNPQRPVYGLIGNGDEFMFIKMLTQGVPQYDFSNIFSLLLPRRNQLQDILCILKQIAQIMITNIRSAEAFLEGEELSFSKHSAFMVY